VILDTISKPPLQSSPEKLTAESASATSPSRLNLARTTGRVAARLGQQFDAVVALALMIATTNPKYLLSSPPVISGLSFLDHSWAFDLVVKAGQHIWMGDRVVFTYGPVFQLASSIVTNSLGGTLGAYFRSWYLLPFCSGIVLTFLTGRILLGGHSVWKRSFYLLALVGFWTARDSLSYLALSPPSSSWVEEPQDRESAGARRATDAAGNRRRGDRMKRCAKKVGALGGLLPPHSRPAARCQRRA